MTYKKQSISGTQAGVSSWVDHRLSLEEQNMLRNASRLPCLFMHVALTPGD